MSEEYIITGVAWKTGDSLVITLPKNQINATEGDQFLIKLTLLKRGEDEIK